jgi:hypothetical protein
MTYRFAVRTLVVPCDAMNHVHHVLRAVPGLASIEVLAACRVLHLVSASRAIGAALKVFPAGTNVQASVVKHVMKTTVTRVPSEAKPEWISLR